MSRSSSSPKRSAPPEPAGELRFVFLGIVAAVLAIVIGGSWLGLFALSPLTWYLARSSGLALFLCAWLLVMTGLGVTTQVMERMVSKPVAFSLHTFLTPLMLGLLILHLASLALDPTVAIGLREELVPFASVIREPWTGLGVIAFELSFLVGITAWFRRFLPHVVWRRLHILAFPAFLAGVLHGLGGGTDLANPVVRDIYLAASLAVLFATCYRLLRVGSSPKSRSGASRTPRRQPGNPPVTRPAPAEGVSAYATADRRR